MNFIRIIPKTFLAFLLIILVFLIYIGCGTKDINNQRELKNADGEIYAGSLVCAKCHSNIYNDFIHTAHFHTSSLPTEKSIKGDFENGNNIFPYAYSTFMLMESRNGKFYQTEYKDGKQIVSERFYIVIGSGTRGQSYLYKKDSQLYELPVSYFTNSNNWSNSPSFPFFEPMFTRAVTARCLECHSTFADMKHITDTDKNGLPKNMIFGIECESCHGPAEKHVEFQEANPSIKTASFIINPAELNRAQKLEMCSYCHSNGERYKNTTYFTFKPGDSLSKYLFANNSVDTSKIDVHGNQAGLLALSKCFKMSKLDCTTCHDTHQQERGELTLFSQRCMNCHNDEHNNFCKFKMLPASILKTNCIDCHMPAKQSKILTVNLDESEKKTPAIIRSHFITIYPAETQKFLKFRSQKN